MIVYIFDYRFPFRDFSSRDGWFADRKKWTVDDMDSIPDVVNCIRSLSPKRGSITLLRLCAHGNTGYMELGKGLKKENAHFFGAISGLFKQLKDGGRGIELHGCGIASSTNILDKSGEKDPNSKICVKGTYSTGGVGYQFVHALAYAAEIPVKAAVNCQRADDKFIFEGPTVTLYQSGYEERSWK